MVGLLLAVGEIFIPSVGLLGFLSVASMLAAIGLAFYTHGVGVGLLFLALTAVAGPVTLIAALRVWPKTPMGRRLLLDVPREDEVLPDTPLRRTFRGLVGKVGTANTLMLPSGVIIDRGTFGRRGERGAADRAGHPDPRHRRPRQPGAGAAGRLRTNRRTDRPRRMFCRSRSNRWGSNRLTTRWHDTLPES